MSAPLPVRSRRTVLNAAAWSVPVIAAATAAPALAVSPAHLGIVFDGGGGTNGLLNSVYLNLYSTSGEEVVLSTAITLSIEVVGLNPNTSAERSFTPGSSYGTITGRRYNSTTKTTYFTWTLPAGTRFPTDRLSTDTPDILFSFGDGLAGTRRITNKIIVRSLSRANSSFAVDITSPNALPIDSSIVKDLDQKAVSPDGIY